MKKVTAILMAAVIFAVPVLADCGRVNIYCGAKECGKTVLTARLPETLKGVYEMLLEKYGIKANCNNCVDFEKDAAQAGNGWMNVPENNVGTNKPEQIPEPGQEIPAKPENEKPAEQEEEQPQYNETDNSSYEMRVLNLVNEQRRKNGVAALTYSYELEAVGKAHSEDMLKNHYFSHNSLDGKTPFDRMRAAGISFGYAAENIAAGQQGPDEVVNSWMNSEGHRKNILNPNYKKMGVGIAYGGSYGIYWTQEFTD